MSMTITIPADLEARLRGEASRRGVDAEAFLRQLVEDRLSAAAAPPVPAPGPVDNSASLAWLDRFEQEDDTSDPQEIARREAEFEAFKQGMNQNRLDSDGPNARIPYP